MSGADADRLIVIGGRQSDELPSAALAGAVAANLARLDRIGLRVPPAVALTTALSREYMARGGLPAGFALRLAAALRRIEAATGRTLGGDPPLLLSVRSSPAGSMPGALKTVLNVGLTEAGVRGLIRHTGNPWFAWDTYRRSLRASGEAVHDMPRGSFERVTALHLARGGVRSIGELDALSLRDLARDSAALVRTATARPLVEDPLAQVLAAIEALLRSWSSPRAREHRRLHDTAAPGGIAVLVQAMVFGNAGERSGSGVGFTRNPATGDDELYVDFAFNAQGEDIVSGREPVPDSRLLPSLLPAVWAELQAARPILERELGDMQDFEFTVEEGRLFFLQVRAGKRTPWAAVRIAADLVAGGIVDQRTALARLDAYDLDAIARVSIRAAADVRPVARATAAGLGVATGAAAFDARRAQLLAADRPVILIRPDISGDDLARASRRRLAS